MLPYNARSAASSSNGILRKPSGGVATTTVNAVTGDARQVELLVFGYACKVFRDDAKAIDIDQGKHLIPWMGDASLKIDRYDVRGALSELSPYEPPPGGYGNRLDYLSAEEQRAEQLCEEERYLYLYNSEEEHILQQEEDLKRLQQETSGSNYGRVGFQYDGSDGGVIHGPSPNDDAQRGNPSPSCEDPEQPYMMPRSLQVPISILLPETMKQHAIIEKTARFIATQGIQMEILLKAKQSNNAQFEFLAQNGLLNPYYKFVLSAIKSGTYPSEETAAKESEKLPTTETALSSQSVPVPKPVITVPVIKYKPSANCAYTQLISKIKGVPLPTVLNEDANSAENMNATTTAGTDSPTTPVLLQYNTHTYVQAAEEGNSNSNSCSNTQDSASLTDLKESQEPQVEILKNSSALALAQNYASDSESEEEPVDAAKPEPPLNFPIPVDNLKNIIDKTATYVIKNGRQFEETLRTKSEERFTFLIPENEFYPYYMYKITGDPDAASKEQKTRKAAAVAAALLSKKGLIAPVSFSIKAKEDSSTTNLPPALPQEASDDDDDERSKKDAAAVQQQRSVPEHVQKAIKLVESQLMARNAQFVAATGASNEVTSPTPSAATATHLLPAHSSASTNTNHNNLTSSARNRFDNTASSKNQVRSTKAEQERNAIYEQQQQTRQKELKKAEEKVKDKLAQIAREKLGGLISKDKQLQLERKRKAMAFLNQIKSTSASTDGEVLTETEKNGETQKDKITSGNMSDSSETSVHSIPITSYGPDDDDEQNVDGQTCDDNKIATSSADLRASRSRKQSAATTTVLLSDDDDVQVIGESRAASVSSSSQLQRRKPDLKRRHVENRQSLAESVKRKYSTDTAASSDTDSSSINSQSSKYNKQRKVSSRHREERRSKSSKKSKKSSKPKKKKKHKSGRSCERSPSSYSQRSRDNRHSQRSHRTKCSASRSRSYNGSSSDSLSSNASQLKVYQLEERASYTPPASPRTSTSSRTYSTSRRKEKKHRRYES